MGKLKSFLTYTVLGMFLLSAGAVGLQGCASSNEGGSTTNGEISEQNKAVAQSMLFLAFAFAPIQVFPPPALKFTGFPCDNGGSIDTDPDGKLNFNDCSFSPGQLFNGGIKIMPQVDGQGGTIEFDNFSGQSGGTQFEINGTITEIETENGLQFDIDIESSTTGGGETDTTDVNGSIFVDDDGNMSGSMNMSVNDSSTNCNFDNRNVFDFQNEDTADQLLENACQEQSFIP